MVKERREQAAMFAGAEGQEEQPVECLGMSFASDTGRRECFLGLLREKMKDPAFRAIEGFPEGDDETILRLSDPPYYTACPNPFLDAFVSDDRGDDEEHDDNDYHREPLAVDVSEGKTDPLYAAHSYHTKVPYKAIVPAILHYTQPGDVVLDGFAGSGMTGVAAEMCGSPDADLRSSIEARWRERGAGAPVWGRRRAVLNDLGPAATFIAANYTIPFDVAVFEREAKRMLTELEREIGWMYETLHSDGQTLGRIQYTVWSQVFACSNCGGEIVFLGEALDQETKRVRESFPCPHCGAEMTKSRMDRLREAYLDPVLNESVEVPRRRPVLISYRVGRARYEKRPDARDLEVLEKVGQMLLPASVPTNEIPFMHMTHQRARMAAFGITRIHQFYLPRAAQALGRLWEKAQAVEDTRHRNMLLFFVEQAIWTMSLLNRFRPTGYSQVNQYMTGVYYVASQHSEVSPWYILEGKRDRLAKAFRTGQSQSPGVATSTASATNPGLPDASVDYIFTDPPFGENIYYADLNFLVESWHRLWTNAAPEAIIDRAKRKDLPDYQRLIERCFSEYYRALKPGHWMTVVFHNSQNTVWNAIQEALFGAGFMIADVRTLDKQQGSYRQVTSTAMKQDLVISAYKPAVEATRSFQVVQGTPESAWQFVRSHLRHLPRVVASPAGGLEMVVERTGHRLYDRLVAFCLQQGTSIPLSFAEFRAGLDKRFSQRDGMYFLGDQVAEYDRRRAQTETVSQPELFVTDESSAVRWLRQELEQEPQTQQDLTPKFLQEIAVWDKYESRLELRQLLEENFIEDDGLWRVPDIRDEKDLEKIRERERLKEFDSYRASKGPLKVFRLEVIRAGFRRAWEAHDYATIVEMGERLPAERLHEDPNVARYYDFALVRSGADG